MSLLFYQLLHPAHRADWNPGLHRLREEFFSFEICLMSIPATAVLPVPPLPVIAIIFMYHHFDFHTLVYIKYDLFKAFWF